MPFGIRFWSIIMNYNEALEYIHSLKVFGSEPTLDRMRYLMERFSNPQKSLKFIHAAGTNGKGSVCTMLAEIYKNAGYKTGLYTSPFIIDFRERIKLDGEFISKSDLTRLTEIVKSTGITVTEFEFITAIAFLYYAEQNCDIVILETGLGGRFDATNIIESPLCSLITKVDLDHTAVLGNTAEEIANEKCGIIKQNCPVVSYPLQSENVLKTISNYTDMLSVPDLSGLEIKSCSHLGNTFIYMNREYTTKLIGEHQIYNAITVITAAECAKIPLSPDNIKNGISSAIIPARLELISKKPTVFLDGAHNPDGARALSEFMKRCGGNAVAVIGMMADKNCEEVLSSTLKNCSGVITVTVKDNPRSLDGRELALLAEKYCSDVTFAKTYDDAIKLAVEKSQNNKPIFVFGSLYLSSALREKLISHFNS